MVTYIHQIYSAFHELPDDHVLIIKGSEEHGYTFSASTNYDAAVAVRTQKLFKKIFREYSIQEILEQHPNAKLSKDILRQIFVKMAVFDDKGPPFNFATLQEFEQIFLDKAPKEERFLKDKAKTGGKGFEGLCEKVYLQWHHYFVTQSEPDPEKTMIRQAEFLASRMADREFQEGAYVYLAKDSIFQVDKTVIGEGAYITILRNLSYPTRIKMICRGTAIRWTSTDGLKSGLNDLQYEIGNGGIQRVWPAIAEYLDKQNIQEVEIYGKSLGGAHTQRLAVLVIKHSNCLLRGVTTVCSVGAGDAEALFKECVEKDERYRNLDFTVIRNGGEDPEHGADYIPCVGGDHLGATVDPSYLNLRVYYIHPTAKQVFPPNLDLNFFQQGLDFASSFPGPHIRQSTLLDFSYQRLDNRQDVQAALRLGTTLEGPRRHLTYKNARSFAEFVDSPSRVAETLSAKKIALVVCNIFLILFFIGFMTCFVLHPGSVVYQGNGIILTIPAIVMAGGAGLSLLAIAIGSCFWWLAERRSERLSVRSLPSGILA